MFILSADNSISAGVIAGIVVGVVIIIIIIAIIILVIFVMVVKRKRSHIPVMYKDSTDSCSIDQGLRLLKYS